MTNNVVLGVLEVCAILSCSWGLYHIQAYSNSLIALTYNGFWFILGILSSISGIISIIFSYVEEPDEQVRSHYFLQYHYFFAWFAIVVGYPVLVNSFWMVYFPSYYAYIHVGLCLIPISGWLTRENYLIVQGTQLVSALAIISHFYISYLAMNQWAMIGSGIMVFNVISLSTPTRYNFIGLSARESFIVGLTSASYVLSLAVEQMAKQPVQLKTIVPW